MPNLLDYVQEVQYSTIYDLALNSLDILALTEISYLPFDGLLPDQADQLIRLDELVEAFDKHYASDLPNLTVTHTPDRLTLLQLLRSNQRFKAIKVFAYVNDYSMEEEKQFAAVSYKVGQDLIVTVFRGTDDTLIGWKEDFHMAYMSEIPAQLAASEYLSEVMASTTGRFYIAGHSKGGNLAIYASSQQVPEQQDRIKAIYAYDSPGVHSSIITSSGYQAIAGKIKPIVPQNSIVGMLLETPKNAQIVKSKTFGLLQHITFSWEIDGHDFTTLENLTANSLQMDETIKSWTAQLSEEELKNFFDLFFGIFIEAGVERISDISVDTPQKLRNILQNSKDLTEEERSMLEQLFRLLLDTRYQVWKEAAHSLNAPYEKVSEWLQQFKKEEK